MDFPTPGLPNYSSLFIYFLSIRQDSNLQLSDWKSDALPIELLMHTYVKMDKLYLHFTQCSSLIYLQQHRIGCFLTLLSTTLLVVTLPPLTRFIFILICTWIGFSYVTPRTTFLPFYEHCFIGTISKTSIDFLP